MDQELIQTKEFFQTHYVPLSNMWLESCVQWFREQQSGKSYSQKELRMKVYEQWLLLDLRDVEVPQLVPRELQEKKVTINRNLTLQMMSVVDISKQKLSQLQKIRNVTHAIVDSEEDKFVSNNNGKRVLLLTLTDGICEVNAMEYKTVPLLNLNMKPGVKIRINAPVILRRGRMMLEQHNVKILGGEVEEILVPNSVENILARALNLSENLNPNAVDVMHSNDEMNTTLSHIVNNSNIQITNRNVETTTKFMHSVRTNQTKNVMDQHSLSVEDEEELRLAAEIDELIETEKEVEALLQPSTRQTCDSFQGVKSKNTALTQAREQSKKQRPEEILDEDIFKDINIDEHLDEIEQQMWQQKSPVPITELLKMRNSSVKGKFNVRAKFKAVVQKLTVTDIWTLQILIIDDSNEMVVSVHSDVISNLIGYQPSAILKLKRDIEADSTEATVQVMKALDGLKGKLEKLNCIMEIEIDPNRPVPIVVAFL